MWPLAEAKIIHLPILTYSTNTNDERHFLKRLLPIATNDSKAQKLRANSAN